MGGWYLDIDLDIPICGTEHCGKLGPFEIDLLSHCTLWESCEFIQIYIYIWSIRTTCIHLDLAKANLFSITRS